MRLPAFVAALLLVPAVTAAHFANMWRRLATRYLAKRVIFGLCNEPHGQDKPTLVRVQNTAIAAIRQDSWIDYVVRIISIGGLAIPAFWTGILIILFLVLMFEWSPPLEYVGITDHSGAAAYAGGLTADALVRQADEIDALNDENPGIRVLKGVEADILQDGSLEYPAAVLDRLDFVIASVHSRFNLDRAAMTARIVAAMENPYVTIIGHPTGRLLLQREPYDLDLDSVLGGAAPQRPTRAETSTAAEPAVAFLESIAVRGFRGIGERAVLALAPGPGLTLVVGRNGSGKSSFAEALELLLTGSSARWAAKRSAIWRNGWRNLHAGEGDVEITARFVIEGRASALTVRRVWRGPSFHSASASWLNEKRDASDARSDAGSVGSFASW